MYRTYGLLQGGSNMTGTDLYKHTHKSVLVIFEPPCSYGYVMSQVVSHQLHTVEDKVQSPTSPRGASGGRSGTEIGFFPSTSMFPGQCHSNNTPHITTYLWLMLYKHTN